MTPSTLQLKQNTVMLVKDYTRVTGDWEGDISANQTEDDMIRCIQLDMTNFIDRTASRIPVKTAREIKLWPIFSSAMPSIRATSLTFR